MFLGRVPALFTSHIWNNTVHGEEQLGNKRLFHEAQHHVSPRNFLCVFPVFLCPFLSLLFPLSSRTRAAPCPSRPAFAPLPLSLRLPQFFSLPAVSPPPPFLLSLSPRLSLFFSPFLPYFLLFSLEALFLYACVDLERTSWDMKKVCPLSVSGEPRVP